MTVAAVVPWPEKCPTCGRRWLIAGWNHITGAWHAVCIAKHRFGGTA